MPFSPRPLPPGIVRYLIKMVGKRKWRRESEQAIAAVAWPLIYALRDAMEMELQVRKELEQTRQTREVLTLKKYVRAACFSSADIMSKRIQQQEECLEIMAYGVRGWLSWKSI